MAKRMLDGCQINDWRKIQWLQKEFTYKMITPMIVVAVLTLHLLALPYAQLSHPVFVLVVARVDLVLEVLLSLLVFPMLFPWATYDARHTQALNQNTVKMRSTVAKAYTFPNRRARGHMGTAAR